MKWHFDIPIVIVACIAIALYLAQATAYHTRRKKTWPLFRTILFLAGVVSGFVALESPLDDVADHFFSAHMLQHLILTDVTAPLLLLGAPILLLMASVSPRRGRRIVSVLRSRIAHGMTFPLVTWTVFIVALWAIHFSRFYEAALEHEPLHLCEHAIYLGTALLFWLPVIAIGPTPWVDGPLAFPMRMLYLIIAMPAEGFLGFSLYGARHILYPHYAVSGLADQQIAGELMWIGSGFAMFVAFMMVGFEWAQHDERAARRHDYLWSREPSAFVPVKNMTQNSAPTPTTAPIAPSASGPR